MTEVSQVEPAEGAGQPPHRAAVEVGPLYGFVRGLARFLVRYHYRVESHGTVPDAGPLLVVSNHTNGLADGGVMLDLTSRPIRYLGKYTLFDTPLVGLLCRWVGVIPVYRQKDNVPTAWNASSFAAVHAALGRGQCIGVFPEGSSHSAPRLQRLKTGTARMALGAEAEHDFALGVRVLPVGIVYDDRDRFRTRVAVRIGEPLRAADWRDPHEADPFAAATEMTDAIADALRSLSIDVDEDEDRERVLRAESILPPDARPRVQRLAELSEAARRLRRDRPTSAERWSRRLDALEPARARSALARGSWLALLVPCALFALPPLALAWAIARIPAFPRDKRVTVTLVAAMVLTPASLLALALFAPAWVALAQLVALAALPASWSRHAEAGRSGPPPTDAHRRLGARLAQYCGDGSRASSGAPSS